VLFSTFLLEEIQVKWNFIKKGKLMAQGLVADNWSLQDISTLFTGGMDASKSDEIIITNNIHSYNPVLYASLQIEAYSTYLTKK
jgi:hypothetical protein